MKTIRICLVGIVLSLIIIGIASHTLLRHSIQLLPLIVLFLTTKKSWSKYAALSVFIFWLFIMSLIWLYLLGLANIISGSFSFTEILTTIIIGIFCVIGLISFFYIKSTSKKLANTGALIAFSLLQIVMMWISLQGFISNF